MPDVNFFACEAPGLIPRPLGRGCLFYTRPTVGSITSDSLKKLDLTKYGCVCKNVVDHFAGKHGETRSGLLAQAVTEYMAARQ